MPLLDLLKSKGQTEEQAKQIIATLGASAQAFEEALDGATAKEQTAIAKLAEADAKEAKLNKFWNEQATPQINDAFSKVATAEAERDFYKRQAESAKSSGFLPKDAPGFTPTPTPTGTPTPAIRAGANEVPGSPAINPAMIVSMITESSSIMGEHQQLFNAPLLDLGQIVEEANTRHVKARQVWEEKDKVTDRRKAIADEIQAKRDNEIRADERKKVQTEYANKYGNEGTRPMMPSRFPTYARDEKTGQADKLAWTRADKREKLRERIHQQIEKEKVSVQ